MAAIAVAATALFAPSAASAADPNCVPTGGTTEECTYKIPVTVAGYEVIQTAQSVPHPSDSGHITKMETDIVDADGTPVPISRLMLHHIVFVNNARRDLTCGTTTYWDNASVIPAFERFYAAGEERAKLALPAGYGYKTNNEGWTMVYMVMNHRAAVDRAFVQYKVTVDTDPAVQDVHPYWLDVENCHADPQYTVPGTGGPGSTHLKTADITFGESGRIVAGSGHVHGGAKKLTLTEPDCGNRQVAESIPTWGLPDHPFYNVKPILHEPGPINMTAFTTPTGIPVHAGERLRLNSIYDNSAPHTRVMGISVIYVAPDPTVAVPCGPLPNDFSIFGTNQPGRPGPVPFTVPLTGLDPAGNAVAINAPPGKLKKAKGGTVIDVGGYTFSKRNLRIKRGQRLRWVFSGDLHNVTLANGPEGFASPNLASHKTFDVRFQRPGTYRIFCSLHPVQMTERVVVKKTKKKHKKGKKGKRGKHKRKG